MGVFDHALTESTDAQLHHGPVVQDLRDKTRSARKLSNHTNQLFFREKACVYLDRGVGVLDVVL